MENNLTKNSQLEKEKEINQIISEITLKHGRSPYSLFIMDNYLYEKKEKSKLSSIEIFKILSEKWHKLDLKEKEKYIKISNEEKEKYKCNIKIIKNYYNNQKEKSDSTSFQNFFNFLIKKYFNKNKEIKEIKNKAYKKWLKMSNEKQLKWKNKIISPDDWIERSKNTKYINSFVIFIYKSIFESKEKKEEIPKFKILLNKWKNISKEEKKKYEDITKEIISERKKLKYLFEIVNEIKQKKPGGAYKIFLSEKANEGIFKGKKNIFKEGREMWNQLSKEEKDDYLNKAKKIKLCYIYKKILYKKNIRKNLPTKPKSSYNFFVSSMKGKNYEKGESFLNMCKREWDKLKNNEKEKFEIEAEKDRIKYESKMKKFQNRIFNFPKRPKTSFQFYIMDKFDIIKKESPDLNNNIILIDIAKEWNILDNELKQSYEIKAENDKERFNIQYSEFKEKGFYTQTQIIETNDIDKKISKRKILKKKKKY